MPAASGASGPTSVTSGRSARRARRARRCRWRATRDAAAELGDARDSRRGDDLERRIVLRQLPGERVLAPAAADDAGLSSLQLTFVVLRLRLRTTSAVEGVGRTRPSRGRAYRAAVRSRERLLAVVARRRRRSRSLSGRSSLAAARGSRRRGSRRSARRRPALQLRRAHGVERVRRGIAVLSDLEHGVPACRRDLVLLGLRA